MTDWINTKHAGKAWAWELEAKHVGVDRSAEGGAAAVKDSAFRFYFMDSSYLIRIAVKWPYFILHTDLHLTFPQPSCSGLNAQTL